MVNDDLLQKFKELLAENNKELKQDFQNRLDAAVDPLHERMDTQREQINTVEKNLSGQINAVKTEITHDVANLVGDSLLPLFDEQEAKITELQKAVGLRPKH